MAKKNEERRAGVRERMKCEKKSQVLYKFPEVLARGCTCSRCNI